MLFYVDEEMKSMLVKRWHIAEPAPIDYLRQYRDMSPVLAQVLYNRGFEDAKQAYIFLHSSEQPGDPFTMKGINKAVGRIRQAIKKKELIVVYGDFDADGVTSTTLMVQVLKELGANVQPYIPHRVDEGYGLNSPALFALAKKGVKLVITVDCGIRSVDEIEDGKRAGLDIIVTDHHSIGPEIPDAYSVINPQQEDCNYPEKKLAGVGVAFTLARALIDIDEANSRNNRRKINKKDLIDLVAIGTVADMMPLNTVENRMLIQYGLREINDGRRVGLRALLEVAGVQPGKVDATSIGFAIGPRINAAGRLESAMEAYYLLSTNDSEEAQKYADELQRLNTKRRQLTLDAQRLIEQHLAESNQQDSSLIFAGHESFLPGIVGLVAGRLSNEHYRPTVILEHGETESRASCRSIPEFNITQALDECSELLVRHGGHAAAAGFTILNENIPILQERLTAIAESALAQKELVPLLHVDMELDLHQLSYDLADEIRLLEPTGQQNPTPLFVSRNVSVLETKTVGSDQNHLKTKIYRNGQHPIDGIGFRLGEWASQMPEKIDVAYHLEINDWNGRQSIQMNIQDIQPSG